MGSSSLLLGTGFEGGQPVASDDRVVLAWTSYWPGHGGAECVPLQGGSGEGGLEPPSVAAGSAAARLVPMPRHSGDEQSYPHCCVLDLGGVFKCLATYSNNGKTGTSSLGNKFLIQPLWEFHFLIFSFPFFFIYFQKMETDYHTSVPSSWFVLWLIITSSLSPLAQVLVSLLASCYPQACAWFYSTAQNKPHLIIL